RGSGAGRQITELHALIVDVVPYDGSRLAREELRLDERPKRGDEDEDGPRDDAVVRQRKCDVPERLPFSRAEVLRGLNQGRIDFEESREQRENHERKPDVNQRGSHDVRATKPEVAE